VKPQREPVEVSSRAVRRARIHLDQSRIQLAILTLGSEIVVRLIGLLKTAKDGWLTVDLNCIASAARWSPADYRSAGGTPCAAKAARKQGLARSTVLDESAVL
jgi:hypothetical protein